MHTPRPARVRPPRSRWDTLEPPKAEVLGVARTLTSATRVLDVMQLLRAEDGIAKYCTVNPGSAFGEGLGDYLAGTDIPLLSWEEARSRTFDLAVTCSVHPSMRQLDAPLMVLPHGAGYNRLVAESTGDATSPAGLSRRELMYEGEVVPAAIGLSHPEQLERLRRTCPEAVPRAHVIGDWCFQRILASAPRRDLYRERLGAVDGRRLVVVHSTWSEHSLLGRHPNLPLDLVTALPADEFAVAAVLHPNVWARHPVYERLGRAMDAGLTVIPPQEGWRAAIVASDWVVGDHGSTSFYSAAADRVVLLAATGLDELDPASPTAAFAREAPRLDPDGDLHDQLLQAEKHYDRSLLKPITDGQLAEVERSGELTQRRLYAFLEPLGVALPEQPPTPEPVPGPVPKVREEHAATYDVEGAVQPDGAVTVRRWPVVSGHHEGPKGFYAVPYEETYPLWEREAEVFARTTTAAELPAPEWCRLQAERLPGANVFVARIDPSRCLVHLRDGLSLEAHTRRPWGTPRPRLDPLLLGAAVNIWLTSGKSGDVLVEGLVVRTGAHEIVVDFTPRP